MITGRHRALNVLAAVDALRDEHPLELSTTLSPRRLWRVLDADGIDVLYRRIRRPARARGFDGLFIITLRHDLPQRDAWRWALHEYAHIKLGHFDDGEEIVRQLSPCRRDDPRELEAKLFARLLMLGPTATPDHPDIARVVAKLETPRYTKRIPEQLPLELPERVPAALRRRIEPENKPVTRNDARDYERRVVRRAAASRVGAAPASWLSGPVISDRMTDDDARIKFYDESVGTARLTDHGGMRWWIYNYRVVVEAGRARRERVRDFMSPTITHRLFVNAAGVQRLYRFANAREQRAYRVKHLDRQLAQAKTLRTKDSTHVRARATHSQR